ncbi:MAG: YceI family protein [Solirubrobacteraceae bacterium]
MSLEAGIHRLGPEHGTLSVKTERTGAAARAGHDLVIHVTSWEARLEVGDDSALLSIALDADPTSLRVHEGSGGMQALGDDDKANIRETIDTDVLKRSRIEFRSSSSSSSSSSSGSGAGSTEAAPAADGAPISVRGELSLAGQTSPVAFDLLLDDDGALSATAVVKQTDWGITPYSALFGALKVVDEVEVGLNARLPSS